MKLCPLYRPPWNASRERLGCNQKNGTPDTRHCELHACGSGVSKRYSSRGVVAIERLSCSAARNFVAWFMWCVCAAAERSTLLAAAHGLVGATHMRRRVCVRGWSR